MRRHSPIVVGRRRESCFDVKTIGKRVEHRMLTSSGVGSEVFVWSLGKG